MVQVLLLHLSKALAQVGGSALYLREALDVLSKFETRLGKPLILSLIADDPSPAPTKPHKTKGIFSENVSALKKLDLESFFEPVARRIILAPRASLCKVDISVFEKGIQRFGQRVSLKQCLLITDCPGDVIAAGQTVGLKVLRFGPEGSTDVDFSDWSEAPALIAPLVAPESNLNKKLALQLSLSVAYDTQLLSITDDKKGGIIHGRAKKLFPVPLKSREGRSEMIEIPFPVNVQITLDKQGRVSAVNSDEPDPETIAESSHFIKTLEANQQISHGRGIARTETHRIETDHKGRKLLKRKRFSAS